MERVRLFNRLPKFVSAVEAKAAKGILRALILGTGEAAAFTPQQTGNLINSQYTVVRKDGTKIVGVAGYTAEYALAVHEATGKLKGLPRAKENGIAQGNYWDPRGEPGFLEKGFERAEPKIRTELIRALKP